MSYRDGGPVSLDSASVTSGTPTPSAPPAPSASPAAASPPSAPPASATGGASQGPPVPTVDTALAALERATSKLSSPEPAIPAQPSPAAPPTESGSPALPTEPTTPAPARVAPATREAPETRIEAAVRNARSKTLERYGLNDRVEPATVQRAITNDQRLHENPRQFVYDLAQELGIPIPAESPPPTTQALVDPEPDLRSEDGKAAYSATAATKLVANAIERVRQELRDEFRPALDFSRESQAEREVSRMRTDATRTVSETLKEARQLPHFVQHEAKIGEILRDMDPAIRKRVGSVAALYMAYNKVLADDVLPGLSRQTESRVVADLQRSATAGATTISPQSPAPVKPVIRDGNVDDLAKHMERLAAQSR